MWTVCAGQCLADRTSDRRPGVEDRRPSLASSDDEGGHGGADRLALVAELGAGGDHGVAAGLADGVDVEHADDVVTGGQRPVVDELLLAVDDPAVVDAGLGVA